ncbi:tyrosine-type recombinase/integrase [Citricoccus parietis]|uniref:tyrosine-type recombinase/integrase n=1 Tax=Citricoccus parietis TaxID=592307 RepID=UPI00366E725D
MATVEAYETKAGRRYRVRYRTPEHRSTDKRGFRTKRDAEAFAATVEVSKLRGEYIDTAASRTTVGQLGPAWLGRQSHLKPSSLRPVVGAWHVHVEKRWGNVAVSDIRRTTVQQWVADLGGVRAPTTVIRAHGVLASILDDAVDDRRLLTNPARGVKLPRKAKKPHVYLSHRQVHDIAEASKHPELVLTLAYCGLRWGEAAGLQVKHLDMLRRRILVERNAVEVAGVFEVGTPKGHKRRSVPFPRFLAERLAKQCEGKGSDALVFPGHHGQFLRQPRVRSGADAETRARDSWFSAALHDAGAPRVTPHDLRHTAASFAVSAGANVKAVQRMLGHSSAAMTLDVYADLFEDDLNAVADRLDEAVSAQIVGKTWASD